MAAYNTLRPLQTSQPLSPPLFSQERQCCARLHRRNVQHHVAFSSSLSLQHLWALFTCRHGKLICRSSTVLVMAFENFPGRVETVVDAGIKVRDLEFFPDILDTRYRENNRAAPPVLPYYPPSDGNGPSELDFEIYASNSMENYEPPPPPRIPFGFPFEDYYDEAIGVDYIAKDENSGNSLLELLGSFNVKKREGAGENTEKTLFSQSPHMAAAEATENKPLLPHSRMQRNMRSSDVQDDSRPIDFTIFSPQAEANLEPNVLSTSNRGVDPSEQLPGVSNTRLEKNMRSRDVQDDSRPIDSTIFSSQAEANLEPNILSSSNRGVEDPSEQLPGVSNTSMFESQEDNTRSFSPQTGSPKYEPREGDLILGVVTFINDQKVDLEIGAELSALMPLKDLQPLSQNVSNKFVEIPVTIEDSHSLQYGESLIVKDKTAFDGLSHNGLVDIGTVVIAEVMAKTIIDGRAVVSCKSPAQRLAWHRIEQLMQLGEAVQLQIVQWNEGGLLGYFQGVRAFVPRSELVQRPESAAMLKNYVGRTLSVAIFQTDRQRLNMVASEVKAWMSRNLQLGTVHNVTVTRVYSYGMQVEIDNTKIRGFVHKTNFSNEYVSSVTNYFAEGDKAKVMLIKGRNSGQISFGLADLEKEHGLLLRDKAQVFRDAEEMGRTFRERLSEQERELFGMGVGSASLDYQDPGIANRTWLHV